MSTLFIINKKENITSIKNILSYMKFKPQLNEPFTVEQHPSLTVDVTKDIPIEMLMATLTQTYQVDDTIPYFDASGEEIHPDFFTLGNVLDESDWDDIDNGNGAMMLDITSGNIIGVISEDPTHADENYDLKVFYAEPIGNQLITNGKGVYFDNTGNICLMYEKRTCVPMASGGDQSISSNKTVTHTLSPYKEYDITSEGVSKLVFEIDKNLVYAPNLTNYTFKGRVWVHNNVGVWNQSALEVDFDNCDLPIVTLASLNDEYYVYSNDTTYDYTIEYDVSIDKWKYISTAPTESNKLEPIPSPAIGS